MIMWFTETAMLLETQATFLAPVKLESNWDGLAHESIINSQDTDTFFKAAVTESNFAEPLNLDSNI